jgi:exonuclease VII small subunit
MDLEREIRALELRRAKLEELAAKWRQGELQFAVEALELNSVRDEIRRLLRQRSGRVGNI